MPLCSLAVAAAHWLESASCYLIEHILELVLTASPEEHWFCSPLRSAGAQVCRDVNKVNLLRAFEEYGRITGHTFLHASDCAFIDFETERDAAAAKDALEGALFDGHRIRIEFKDEARGPPRGGGRRIIPPAYGGADARQRCP